MSASEASAAPRKRVLTVVGARPQFIKAAVVSRAFRQSRYLEEILVHTGQHFDAAMSDVFFKELGIPEPYCNLNVGPEAPAVQLAALLERLAPVMGELHPDAVLVYGDTNSTLAAALAAAQQDIPLIHVEAGERIYRRRQVPEETNRVLTDNLASLNLTATLRACDFLRREGMAAARCRFVGDPLYDLFLWAESLGGAHASFGPDSLGLAPGGYHLATIHRAQNTASRAVLLGLLEALDASTWPVVLPLHPRTRKLIEGWGWRPTGSLRPIEPVGYFDFLALLRGCRVCFTDSGGVTREAFFARRPCVIPMETCWWGDAIESGWAVSTGLGRDEILQKLDGQEPPCDYPEGLFGDGHAAERIVTEVEHFLSETDIHPIPVPREAAWHRHGSVDDLPPARPTDFSLRSYRRMLERLAGEGYSFARFDEAGPLLAAGRPFVLLRHDIDCDPERALPLAEIETSLGIRSTCFLMIRNELYNVFSESGSRAVRRLLELGHGLGLHFDMAAYPGLADAASCASACRREAAMLAEWFGQPVEAVSFHRPGPLALAGDPALSAPLPHAYMPLYTKTIKYYADSQGRWKYGAPLEGEAFRERRPLQILVHPVWWNETPVAPYETLLRLIDGRREALERYLARNNGVYRAGCLSGENEERPA